MEAKDTCSSSVSVNVGTKRTSQQSTMADFFKKTATAQALKKQKLDGDGNVGSPVKIKSTADDL